MVVIAAGGIGAVYLITGGAEETGAGWMTAPVEMSQPRDLSKVAVVVEMFLSSEVF